MVVGITGSGKSWLVKMILLDEWPRVAVWDPKHEYRNDHADAPAGMRQIQSLTLDEFEDLVQSYEPARRGPLCVSVHFSSADEREEAEAFKRFCELVRGCRDLHLIIDEIVLLPAGAHGALKQVACVSRDWGIPVTMVAQRATDIPRTSRLQCRRIVSFFQLAIDDAGSLREIMGPVADRITSLPEREFVAWHFSDAFARPAPSTEETTLGQETSPAPRRKVARKIRKKTARKRTTTKTVGANRN